jgi:hypothetical protein
MSRFAGLVSSFRMVEPNILAQTITRTIREKTIHRIGNPFSDFGVNRVWGRHRRCLGARVWRSQRREWIGLEQ